MSGIINIDKSNYIDTKFIEQLYADIDKQSIINKNPKLFIQKRNIKEYNFQKKILKLDEEDLPIQSLMGSIFLIKNTNIIECYSWCDYKNSKYVQINNFRAVWISKFDIINLDDADSENIKFMLDGNDIIYQPSVYQYIILQFIKSGFQIYIH
jgi:hypothetical protein